MMHPSKVAGVMVMLASALQRPHADNKARETKVETSVALQQEVKIKLNFQPSLKSLKVFKTQSQVEPHNDFFTTQFLVPFPQVEII